MVVDVSLRNPPLPSIVFLMMQPLQTKQRLKIINNPDLNDKDLVINFTAHHKLTQYVSITTKLDFALVHVLIVTSEPVIILRLTVIETPCSRPVVGKAASGLLRDPHGHHPSGGCHCVPVLAHGVLFCDKFRYPSAPPFHGIFRQVLEKM